MIHKTACFTAQYKEDMKDIDILLLKEIIRETVKNYLGTDKKHLPAFEGLSTKVH